MIKSPMQSLERRSAGSRSSTKLREAEERANPRPPVERGPVDPAQRPPLAFETPAETNATRDWLAHIAAGRIQVC